MDKKNLLAVFLALQCNLRTYVNTLRKKIEENSTRPKASKSVKFGAFLILSIPFAYSIFAEVMIAPALQTEGKKLQNEQNVGMGNK